MNSSLYTPDFSHLTGLLKHLNDDELKELLHNDEKLKTLINDVKQVRDVESEREMLLTSNKSISEYNLSKRPILEEQRKQVEETRNIALELKDSLLEKKRKLEANQQSTSKETILALLQAATSEKEEEAEAAVDTFLENELSVEDFLPKYLELRKVAHLRRIKAEKLTNILQENGSRNIAPPPRPKPRKPPTPPIIPNSQARMENNMPQPVRPAPGPPPVHTNMPQVYNNVPQMYNNVPPVYRNMYPPGQYQPNQMRPGAAPFSYMQPYPPPVNPYIPVIPKYK